MNRVIKYITKVNLLKSIYYSIKSKGFVIIGYRFKINNYGGEIVVNKGGRLYLGTDITWEQPGVLDLYKHGKLKINGKVSINKGSKIMIGENAVLEINHGTYINEHSRVQCRKNIKIGCNCAISWGVNILDTDEHKIFIGGKSKESAGDVVIGDHVWIGTGCIILKKSTIENNCIVGAGTVVAGHLRSHCIYTSKGAKLLVDNVESWQ